MTNSHPWLWLLATVAVFGLCGVTFRWLLGVAFRSLMHDRRVVPELCAVLIPVLTFLPILPAFEFGWNLGHWLAARDANRARQVELSSPIVDRHTHTTTGGEERP